MNTPDHLVTILKSILVSHPVALIVGQVPVAAFVIVNSLTALATEVVGNLINSLLHPSLILLFVAPSNVIHPLIITASELVLENEL